MIRPFEFVRLLRFIRLWKKLGWSIEQTDKAIAALYPADQLPNDADDNVNLQRLDAGFLALLPRLGVLQRVIDSLNLNPKKDLLPLLACFAPLDTYGCRLTLSQALPEPGPAQARPSVRRRWLWQSPRRFQTICSTTRKPCAPPSR